MKSDYDVVIIGGGHNGVVAALTLAIHGVRVLVVEQNYSLGGLAGGRYVYGVASSRYAYVVGLVPSELEDWLHILPEMEYPEPNWVELGDNDEILFRWWISREKLLEEFREKGVDVEGLFTSIKRFWKCYKNLGLYYTVRAPSREEAVQVLDKCGVADIVAKSARQVLSEHVPREYWDYFIYPSMLDSSGFALAYYMQNNNVWGRPKYSMVSFSRTLVERLRENRVAFAVGARVTAFRLEGQRVAGVILSSGEKIYSRMVLFAAPITSLLDIDGSEKLYEYELRRIEKARKEYGLRSKVKRIDYVFTAKPLPPREEGWRGTPIYVRWRNGIGGEYTYVEPQRGMYLVQFSGFADDVESVMPPGTSPNSLVGYEVRDRVRQVVCCKNYTGHPDHLPMIDKYLFDYRPVPGWNDYRTSLPCLYHGSASSYPGGELNGVAGLNAALRILVDLGIKPNVPFLKGPLVSGARDRGKWDTKC